MKCVAPELSLHHHPFLVSMVFTTTAVRSKPNTFLHSPLPHHDKGDF